MRRTAWIFVIVTVASVALTRATPARAEPSDADRREAAERFDHALRLVNNGNLSGGLGEFQRAYVLVPAPVVSFNLGLVQAAMHRPVEAARALEQALAHREALKPDDVERAERELREQRANIATIAVTANVRDGVVEVDNVEVAKLPLAEPLALSSGAHVIGVVSPGYAPARREVIVAGQQAVSIALDLVAIEGRLAHIAVACKVPAADVFVDGARVGKTPLLATITVAPGAHDVEVRRAGYTPARQNITLQDGSRADLALTPAIDSAALPREGGFLKVHPSETQSVVSVDGTELGLLPSVLSLPAGPHRLQLERGGFLAAQRDVDVTAGSDRAVEVVLEPTPETRVDYVTSARKWRTVSVLAISVGTALAVGGSALAIIEQRRLSAAQRDFDAVLADQAPGSHRPCDTSTVDVMDAAACMARAQAAADRVNDLQTPRTVGWVVAGIGGAAALAGAVLLLTSDNPHRYDEKPTGQTLSHWRLLPDVRAGHLTVSALATF